MDHTQRQAEQGESTALLPNASRGNRVGPTLTVAARHARQEDAAKLKTQKATKNNFLAAVVRQRSVAANCQRKRAVSFVLSWCPCCRT